MKSRIASNLLVVMAGCWQLGAAHAAPSAADAGIAFEHRIEHSRFDVGADPQDRSDAAHRRIAGDRGVFSVDTVTGAALAIPSSSGIPKDQAAIARLPTALTNDPEVHSAEVRRYLLASGIPQAEVGGMHVTTTMAGGGPVEDGVQPARSTFLWYTTHLERSLAGIPVENSVAFAALGSDGRAITEGVYWPAIPAEVVRQAVALKARLAAPEQARAFLDQVGRARPEAVGAEGEVRIVHTGPGYHGPFEARAVYSAIVRTPGGGKARILRFDDQATLVRLADETVGRARADSPKER
jgi:hypothetical protein